MWTVTSPSFTDTGAAGASGSPPSVGTLWQVKNLLELKNAERVKVQYNLFENNWQAAQPGYAILFTPRNQDGHCPWCIVDAVEFSHNILRNTAAGFNILGHDSPNPSQQTTGITVVDNLVYGVSTSFGGNGWAILAGDGPSAVSFDHNTFDFDGTTLFYAYGGTASAPAQITGFRFTNNAAPSGQYGINGGDASPGNLALEMYRPGAVVTGNWLSGAPAAKYPGGNRFETPFEGAFVNRAGHDYRLGGPLAAPGEDGRPVGADVTSLATIADSVSQGVLVSAILPPAHVRLMIDNH